MTFEDKEYQTLAGIGLQKAMAMLAPSEGLFSTAIDTGNDNSIGLDGVDNTPDDDQLDDTRPCQAMGPSRVRNL